MNDETKRGSWFKWIIGSIIALIGAGGGLVAFLQYLDDRQETKNRQYQQALTAWENFSPQSLSRGIQKITLRGLDRFDLETGRVTSNPESNLKWDIMFGCWPNARESLRASDGVKWFNIGVVKLSDVGYRDIRDASFSNPRHPQSGNRDFYYSHISNVPGPEYAYAVKTSDNNVAKVQIVSYRSTSNDPNVCRDVTLRYEIFPIVQDPPRPRRK